MVKINGKIFKKIAFIRIIAIAKNYFVSELLLIMTQLILYIGKLSIKLIIFCLFGMTEFFIVGYGAS